MKIKRILAAILLSIAALSMVACDGDSGGDYDNDYKPGNPQYDYDAWKYGQDHPGFYDD